MPKEKILIVDDEEDVLHLCQRILETQGYNVTVTHNGYEAINVAQTQQFDLLLTDIKMPGMNGLEIAQMLKDADPEIICVTMTGFSTMDMAINALKLGIDEFILKPFTPNDLGNAVARALEKERLRKENVRLHSLIPLFELNKGLMSAVDVDQVLHHLLNIAQNETKAHFVGMHLMENGETSNHYQCLNDASCSDIQREASAQLAKYIFESGEATTFNLNKVDQPYDNLLQRLEMVSVIATPLKSQNANLGVLILAHPENYFAPGDSEFLSILCSQASIALDNARLFTKTQDDYTKLQMLDHMKSEFINIAAHELRTPLAILMGYASVLEEEMEDLHREFASNIMRNALRLRTLIDDILNLQYLESGVALLAHDELNLAEVAQDMIKDISLLAEEKQLEVSIQIPDDFPKMIIDRQKFDLILVNLIHNAVKFTPVGGKIVFKAASEDSKAIMTLHNSGTIIPQDKLIEIFDRFYQTENSLTREYGGAGLGLAIAQGMTEVCGGEIYAESGEEEGTTFTCILPFSNSHLEARRLKL